MPETNFDKASDRPRSSSDTPAMNVAVIGIGRMGRHHARIYHELAQANLVAVVDQDTDRAEDVAEQYGCAFCADTTELLSRFPQVQAVTVAVPTAAHARAAKPLIENGVACLIEKPLAPTADQARQLADLAKQHHTTLAVGHTERFNPAITAVAAMDITPRFMEINRISPMTFRSLDVGVVMDMMIHDLDIVLKLANSPLKKVDATGVSVLSQHEDIANARLVFENGCVANLTASRLALKTERKLRLFSEAAYVSLDYQKRDGLVLRMDAQTETLARVRQQIAQGLDLSELDYSELVQVEQLTMDGDGPASDPLTMELASFIEAVRTKGAPPVDGYAGCAAIEAAERVVAAISAHQWVGLTDSRSMMESTNQSSDV